MNNNNTDFKALYFALFILGILQCVFSLITIIIFMNILAGLLDIAIFVLIIILFIKQPKNTSGLKLMMIACIINFCAPLIYLTTILFSLNENSIPVFMIFSHILFYSLFIISYILMIIGCISVYKAYTAIN